MSAGARRLAWWLIPVLTNSTVLTGAMLLALLTIGRETPDLSYILHSFIVLFAATCWGYACGLRLPLVMALPLALLSTWLPNLLVATPPEWLRLLRGAASGDCCTPGTELSRLVLAAGFMCAAGLALLALGWLLGWRSPATWTRVAVLLVGLTLVVGAIGLVHDKPAAAAVQARTAPLTCDDVRPQLCSWADGVRERRDAAEWFQRATAIAEREGMPIPTQITSSPNARWPRSTVQFGYLSEIARLREQAYVSALVPQPEGCVDLKVLAA